ncbi:MAG: GntR family transcriptional regulator [Clostridiales bacterium]|nr:GntR family transcriptional regulator [Clostridiales bacterium]
MTQKPGLVQIAYDKILHDILAFALKPGDLISDYQLSKDIGMSRTPVREAIRKLMYDSLVVIDNGKTVVADISEEDIRDITELRSALERQAIEILITRRPLSVESIAQMRQLNVDLEQAIRTRDFRLNFDIEDRFHGLIVKSCGNQRIIEAYQQYHLLIVRARWLSLFYPDYEPTLKEHEAIVDALEKKSREDALAAMDKHMFSSYKHFSRVFTDPEIRAAARFVALLK